MSEPIGSDDIQNRLLPDTEIPYAKRWEFEKLTLVPELGDASANHLNFVLGSHDPMARDLAFSIGDIDVFNLSFTPAEQINKIHEELTARCERENRRPWHRQRLPRTVLTFIDEDSQVAKERCSACFDTYIEAMRGTVELPPKEVLASRALVGSPAEIIEQLDPRNPRGFHEDDCLMLWFEFNQADAPLIGKSMELFWSEVAPRFAT